MLFLTIGLTIGFCIIGNLVPLSTDKILCVGIGGYFAYTFLKDFSYKTQNW
jgi:hypothetical protein